MEFIINKFGIAFVVTVEVDRAKLEGCRFFHSLYDMNVAMPEEAIGYEYLISRESKDSPIMLHTDFNSTEIRIETEKFICEYIL
ncbi:hypothetical protein OFDDKENP_00065 [Aeromonas phage B614]|nr:hypothetical protein OFDDKENP_00065 [Aeromonas phage B614]UYD58209.1 hypothetical protein JNEOFJEA_00112 [Aeromonas phage UP87]UYD58572.1 hypothetical protein IPAKJDPM_00229 [Aeromonas phage avDM14-QBC]UYD58786.1 hypothetical protein HNNIDBEH_00193 [Aeromonas phage avDM10-HWA]UYD58910.1 hypothetical protein OFOPOMKI_00060 [Aeromonas phage avDM7-IJDJ]UYD59969.1 hypothetical protein LEHPIFIF_00213 [Aeromonas phage avDM9-HANS]